MSAPRSGPLAVYVGSYADGPGGAPGGIDLFHLESPDAGPVHVAHTDLPRQAGFLLHSPQHRALYAVDERKSDGRGPVGDPAAVHAFRTGPDGRLTPLGSVPTVGPFPTYLALRGPSGPLISANHGSFEHVETVVPRADGTWDVEHRYDDSTLVLYGLRANGEITGIEHVEVFTDHGLDPNSSPQADGHGQASAHAHCAVLDPAGKHLLVCDKGADTITVYALEPSLRKRSVLRLAAETGPRHLVFDPATGLALVTCEFASTLASLAFDPGTGELGLLHQVPTTAAEHEGLNEPADVRVPPRGGRVYVNNRGEDSLAWFGLCPDGRLERLGHVPLARSEHPGVAARSFAFTPDGSALLVADRPADLVRLFDVDPGTGALTEGWTVPIPAPAFIEIAELAA